LLTGTALTAGAALLQACQGAAPSPTTAPTKPAEATKPPATTKAAEATKPAAGATSAATKPAAGATSTTKGAASGLPKAADVTITDKLIVLQEKDYNPHHNDFLNADVTEFAKQNNWALDLSYTEAFTGGTNFNQKIAAAVSSGTPPDMMFGAKDAFTLWYLKALQPVDDVVEWATQEHGEPIPGLKTADNFEGHWWAAPFFTRVGGWWSRKSWFDAIGYDVTAEHNFNEWREAAVEVTNREKEQYGWAATVNRSGDGESFVYQIVFEAGGRYTNEDGSKVVFESEQTIAGFNWLKETFTEEKWKQSQAPGILSWNDTSNNQAWVAGKLGFTSNAGTLFALAVKDAPDVGNDTFLVPQPIGPVGEKQQLTGAGGASLYLFANAKNPEASKVLMQHLLSKEIQKKIWEITPGYPTPAYKWGWDEPEIVNSPNNVSKTFEKIVYAENFSSWMPGPGPRLWINAIGSSVVLTETMADILTGTPVEQAVATAQKKIEEHYAKFEGK
jgi:multiple sugar transport system substrate-binding protein